MAKAAFSVDVTAIEERKTSSVTAIEERKTSTTIGHGPGHDLNDLAREVYKIPLPQSPPLPAEFVAWPSSVRDFDSSDYPLRDSEIRVHREIRAIAESPRLIGAVTEQQVNQAAAKAKVRVAVSTGQYMGIEGPGHKIPFTVLTAHEEDIHDAYQMIPPLPCLSQQADHIDCTCPSSVLPTPETIYSNNGFLNSSREHEMAQSITSISHDIPRMSHEPTPPSDENEDLDMEIRIMQKEVHRKGRSIKQDYRLRKHAQRLAGCPAVWEFGVKLDFSSSKSMENYLTYYSGWLNKSRKPWKDYDKFKDFVKCHFDGAEHRVYACTILAGSGHGIASVFCRFRSGKMTKKEFEKVTYSPLKEKQTGVELAVMAGIMVTVMLALMAHKWVTPISGAASKAEDLLDSIQPLLSAASSVVEFCKTVWGWVKNFFRRLYSMIEESDATIKAFLFGYLLLIAVMIGIEFANSMGQKRYVHNVRIFLLHKAGFLDKETEPEIEVQAGSDRYQNPIRYCLEFIRTYLLRVPSVNFWRFSHKIVEVKNLACALEWLIQHGNLVYNWCIEAITGEPRPRTALERDILSLDHRVQAFKQQIDRGTIEEMVDAKTHNLRTELRSEEQRLERAITGSKEAIRAYMSSTWSTLRTHYRLACEKIDSARYVARPRSVPVWVYIYGGPGIGKSEEVNEIMNLIHNACREHAKAHKSPAVRAAFAKLEPFTMMDVCSMNQKENYWDGYLNQFFLLIDDIFQATDKEVRSEVAQELIAMCSQHGHNLLTADMNLKGHKWFNSRCILSTSNMHDFRTANLGLQSYAALSGRRTICVEKVGDDQFLIDGIYDPERKDDLFDPTLRRCLTRDELCSLAAACIIEREYQKRSTITERVPAPFTGRYKGGRIELQAGSDSDPIKDKGKEKVQDETAKADTELDSSYATSSKDKIPPNVHYKRNGEWCLGDDVDGCAYCKRADPMDKIDSDIVRRVQEKLGVTLTVKPSYKVKSLEESKSFVDYMDQYLDGDFNAEKVKQMRRLFPRSGLNRSWNDSVDEKIWKHLIPSKFFIKKMNENPGMFLPRLGIGFMNCVEIAWAMCDSESDDNRCRQFFANAWIAWARLETGLADRYRMMDITDPEFKVVDWFETMKKRYCWSTLAAAAIAGVVLGASAIISLFQLGVGMPRSVYKEKQGYDHSPNAKKNGSKLIRKIKTRNPRVREIKTHKTEKQNASDKLLKISQNYDVLEMRLGYEGQSYGEVMEEPAHHWSWCLCLGLRYYLIPLHTVLDGGSMDDVRYVSLSQHGKTCFVFGRDVTIIKELGGDLAIVEFPKVVRDRPKITGYFVDHDISHSTLAHLRPYRGRNRCDLHYSQSWEPKVQVVNEGDGYFPITTNVEVHGIPNEKGCCGTVYVDVHTSEIMGIHMGGSPTVDRAYVVAVKRKDFADLIPRAPEVVPIDFGPLKESQCGGGVQILGVLDNHNTSFISTKTALRESTFDYPSFPVPMTRDGPARLYPFTNQSGEVVSPMKLAFDKFDKQATYGPGSPPLQSYRDFFGTRFNPNVARKMCSIEEACFGIPGVMDGVPLDASLGWHFKKLRKLGIRDRRDLIDKERKWIHPILRRAVEKWFENARAGIVTPAVYEENLKDEIRDWERVEQGKTRLFAAGDLVTMIATKMVLGLLFVELEKDPTRSPVAVAINVHSSEWSAMWSDLCGLPEEEREFIFGDFGSYDISLECDDDREFIEEIQKFHDEPELVQMVFDANQTYAYHILRALLFLRLNGTRSGSYLTTVINTFKNWCKHKKAWRDLHGEDSWYVVRSKFCGDDSLVTVPKAYAAYNAEYLRKWFREKYQMDYTDPYKKEAKRSTKSEAVFLKRKFVTGEYGLMAPLALDSIANMIRWTTDRGDLSVMQSVIHSMQLEVFHHGRELYDRCYKWVIQESIRLGYYFECYSWDQMWERRKSFYTAISSRDEPKSVRSLDLKRGGEQPSNRSSQGAKPVEGPLDGNPPKEKQSFGPAYGSASRLFNGTATSIGDSTGIQSDSPQELSTPATTVGFSTPTMTFGDVGVTHQTQSKGKINKEHSVGHFPDVRILERERLLQETTWTTAEAAGSLVFFMDVYKNLIAVTQISAVLSQFMMFRADVEVTVRLNSNQFFYGLLAISMFPAGTGHRLDERMVQSPTLISASQAENCIKEWKFTYPYQWISYFDANAGNTPVYIYADVLAPLTAANENMPNNLNIQFWGRFKNIEVSWPTQNIPLATNRPLIMTTTNLVKPVRVKDSDVKDCRRKPKTAIYKEKQSSGGLSNSVCFPISFPVAQRTAIIQVYYPSVVNLRDDSTDDESSSDEFDDYDVDDPGTTKARQFPTLIEKQSAVASGNNVNLTVTYPTGSSGSPTKDKNSDEAKKNSVDKAWDAMKSISIGDAGAAIWDLGESAVEGLVDLAGAVSFAVDKPDRTDPQDRIIIDQYVDMFNTDIPDGNVSASLHRSRYMDPGKGRVPMSKDWTLSEYAQIPGLRATPGGGSTCFTFTNSGDTTTIPLIALHPDSTTYKIPLDFAYILSGAWRGSIKVMLYFVTSSFASARFTLQYINQAWFGTGVVPTEYDCGISRVINVKGTTIDCISLPWLSGESWSYDLDPSITITMETEITSTDTVTTPHIYLVMFVAGGPDIQFQLPRVPAYGTEWSSSGQTFDGEESENLPKEKQTAVQDVFSKKFPPIVEGCFYDLDNGHCTTEQIGSLASLAKRYSAVPYPVSTAGPSNFCTWDTWDLKYDFQPAGAAQPAYYRYWQFRGTLFGAIRSMFLFRCGGVRYRRRVQSEEQWTMNVGAGPRNMSFLTHSSYDGFVRVTIPYASKNPYGLLGYITQGVNLLPAATNTPTFDFNHQEWVAARDDIQFGWPILPTGLVQVASSLNDPTPKRPSSLKATRGKGRTQLADDGLEW